MVNSERSSGTFGSMGRNLGLTILVTLLIFFLVVLLFCSFSLVSRRSISGDEEKTQIFGGHVKLELNRQTGQQPEEKSSISRVLEKSYFDDDILVNNYGSKEYECTGSCTCSENIDERRTGNTAIIRSGISIFVAGVTSVLAINKAKDYFKEECIERLSDSCSLSSISHEVEQCEQREPLNNEIPVEFGDHVKDIRKYWCYGHCLPKNFKKRITNEMALKFGCSRLQASGEIEVDLTGKEYHSHNTRARSVFQKTYLTKTCKRESGDSYYYFDKKQEVGRWISVIFCVGTTAQYWLNPTIRCSQVFPEKEKVGPKPNNKRLKI